MEAWAHKHWFLFFILALVALDVVCKIIGRTYRVIMVMFRGWPTNGLDADGDHPRKS